MLEDIVRMKLVIELINAWFYNERRTKLHL